MCGLRHSGNEWLLPNISAKEVLSTQLRDFRLFSTELLGGLSREKDREGQREGGETKE